VIDLGELMIVMRVKVDASGKPQTLFDFGSSLDNRMTLTVDKGGKLALQWTVGGKSESLSARKPLVEGRWATIRVEIDGRRVALVVDESAAEKKSDFRAAYVYAPQFARRNLIFRRRDEKTPNYATGQLDYLRVYSEVAEDFAALPAPPTVSPNKAMPEVFEKLDEEFGGRPGHKRMVDDLKQLRIALKLQDPSQWLFTTDDWNTEHKLEEDFENKNERVRRWMKRVKPYRYQ